MSARYFEVERTKREWKADRRSLRDRERHGLNVVLEKDTRHASAVLCLSRHVRYGVLVRVEDSASSIDVGGRDDLLSISN